MGAASRRLLGAVLQLVKAAAKRRAPERCPCGSARAKKACCGASRGAPGYDPELRQVVAQSAAAAMQYLLQGDAQSGEALAARALALDPEHAGALGTLALCLHGLGQPDEALEAMQRAATLDPGSFDLQNNLAQFLLDRLRLEEGLQASERACALDPAHPAGLNVRGGLLRGLGRTGEAIACFEAALRADPAYAAPRYNLGLALGDDGRLPEALAAFEAVRAAQPGAAQVHNNIGMTLQGLGRTDEAAAACRHALALDPGLAEAHANLAALLLGAGDAEGAIAEYGAALARRPGDAGLTFFLGAMLVLHGRETEGRALLAPLAQGSALDRARLDALEYVVAHRPAGTPLLGSPVDAFRVAFASAPAAGLVLDFGVRHGTSTRVLAGLAAGPVHGFDSFEGLPEDWHDEPRGSYSTGGVLPAMPPNVTLHAGWFEDSVPAFLARHPGPLRLANIDCDLYSSTRTVLEALAPRIAPGAVLVFDEYLGHAHWREDEFRAFQEAVARHGWRYEYLAFGLGTKQAVVRFL